MGLRDSLKNFFVVHEEHETVSPRADVIAEAVLKVQQAASSKGAKRDPLATIAKKIGLALGSSNDGRTLVTPETDLSIIDTVYDAESYVRQGIDKYIDKMFKAGWSFTGKNPQSIDYIRQRFAMMAETTQIPTDRLFMEYSEDVVKYSNSIIAKGRMTDPAQLPQGFTIQGLGGAQPVIGYFPLNVTTMKVARDKNGTIKSWQQQVSGGSPIKFKPADIIFTYFKRQKGNAFGTPFLLPVLDDIRTLRQAEDNVVRMLYRNIYPFYHIKIGSEEFPADDPEIDDAKTEVEGMSVEGGLVTSERWNINAISADKVVDARPYLDYYEARVFSGLGVPATMFGRGATANKSTSDNMDNEFIDRVKAFQKIIEADVNEFMIKELLMEGGFDPVLNVVDMVYFKFNEIDVDMQIKLENQAIYKYEHVAITEDEMRQLIGLDPITDRSKMYTNLVTKEKSIAEAQGQLLVAEASAKFAQNSSANTSSGNNGNAETNNKVQPKNQTNAPKKGSSTTVKPSQKTKTKNDVDIAIGLYIDHLEELNDIVNDYIRQFCGGDIHALARIKSDIYLKSKIFEDIDNNHLNSEIVDKAHIMHSRMFLQLTEQIVEALTSMRSEGTLARDSALEIINSVFKVMIHRAEDILNL